MCKNRAQARRPAGAQRTLLSELTGGKVELSDEILNHLSEEFALKSGFEKKEIISRLMSSPVMNANLTNANVNGHSVPRCWFLHPLLTERHCI